MAPYINTGMQPPTHSLAIIWPPNGQHRPTATNDHRPPTANNDQGTHSLATNTQSHHHLATERQTPTNSHQGPTATNDQQPPTANDDHQQPIASSGQQRPTSNGQQRPTQFGSIAKRSFFKKILAGDRHSFVAINLTPSLSFSIAAKCDVPAQAQHFAAKEKEREG